MEIINLILAILCAFCTGVYTCELVNWYRPKQIPKNECVFWICFSTIASVINLIVFLWH